MSGRTPRFRFTRAPEVQFPVPEVKKKPLMDGGGLDERSRRLHTAYRKANPFCRWCQQNGRRDEPAMICDHILPRREYPELTYAWKNLQGLCYSHDALKQSMESFARKNGLVHLLLDWSSDPKTRPPQFRAV